MPVGIGVGESFAPNAELYVIVVFSLGDYSFQRLRCDRRKPGRPGALP